MIVGNLVAKLTLDAKGFRAGVAAASRKITTLNKTIAESTRHLRDHYAALLLVGGGVVYATKRFADMAVEMQAINRRMEFVTGGGAKLARAMTFLRKTSKQLSLSLEDLTSVYGKLAAATRSTGLSVDEVESIFLAISQAASVFGLSSEKTKLTFLAIQQMASKSTIQMEELKRQLGDHLPGALNTMAEALGVSTAELNKLVATGKLISEDVLPLFALQLRKDMVEPVSKLGKGVRASLADMKTAWFDFKQEITREGGIGEAIAKETIDIGSALVGSARLMAKWARVSVEAISEVRKTFTEFAEKHKIASDKVVEATEDTNNELAELTEEHAARLKTFWENFGSTTEEEIEAWREVVVGSPL
jgi:tape measure domain-containing protein